MEHNFNKFENGLKELNISLSSAQLEQFSRYYDLLVEWNSFMNLTSITEWEDVITKHFLDSLSIIKVFPSISKESLSLIDVGTGAGFPGIPIKIAFPNVKVTLLDSLNKRINFLNEVINSLGLLDIDAFHGRAEDFGHNSSFRESFDICVSRAVANMTVLSEFCFPFVKVNGYFIPYKADKAYEEYEASKSAISILGGELKDSFEFTLPDSDLYRVIFLINKIKNTSSKYPRKAGVPTKNPLM